MKKLLTIALALTTVAILSACEFNVSTANITDVSMCSEKTENLCDGDSRIFATDTPEIIVTAILNNAPEGTEATFDWMYLEGEPYLIDTVSVTSEYTTTDLYSSLSIPDDGWPAGAYKVTIKLNTDNSEPIDVEFSIE